MNLLVASLGEAGQGGEGNGPDGLLRSRLLDDWRAVEVMKRSAPGILGGYVSGERRADVVWVASRPRFERGRWPWVVSGLRRAGRRRSDSEQEPNGQRSAY